jgi:hypothetical protein
MIIARTILALLVAFSLAVLPAAGHAGLMVKAVDASAMDHMGTHDMSAMADMDCCPHKTVPAHKAIDDCASMVGCGLCTGLLGAAASSVNFPLLLSSRVFLTASDPLFSQAGSPPFRPPRI